MHAWFHENVTLQFMHAYLQVLAIEFIAFAIEFIILAIEYSTFYQFQLSFSVSSITLHGENDLSCEKEAGFPVNSVMTNFHAKATK